jgi:hypothetical protein
MTLFELFNTDLTELNKKLETDKEIAVSFNRFFENVGMSIESGRQLWLQIDHDLNCLNCKVSAH